MNIAIEKTSNCRYCWPISCMVGATFMCACVHLYVANVCVYIVCEMRVASTCMYIVNMCVLVHMKGREEMN